MKPTDPTDPLPAAARQHEAPPTPAAEPAPPVNGDPAWALHDAPAPPIAVVQATVEAPSAPNWSLADDPAAAAAPAKVTVAAPSFALDHLELVAPDAAPLAPAIESTAAAVAVREAPAGWSLLDATDPTPPAAAVESAIEKTRAVESLAPAVETRAAAPPQPGLGLELLSIEAASAPRPFGQPPEIQREMLLDRPDHMLSRIVLLGAPAGGEASLRAFLRALPAPPRAVLVIVWQQAPGASLDDLGQPPPRWVVAGERLRHGQIVMVPAGHLLRLRRDGRVELEASGAPGPSSSIDAHFSHVAEVFGTAALGIVFAGDGLDDAVAGARAIRDRGGRVWVEAGERPPAATDRVARIQAQQLANHAASPAGLATRLFEELS